jgi:hypothetical protein
MVGTPAKFTDKAWCLVQMIISLMVYYFLLSLPMAVCDWLPPMVLQLIYSFVYVSIVFFILIFTYLDAGILLSFTTLLMETRTFVSGKYVTVLRSKLMDGVPLSIR